MEGRIENTLTITRDELLALPVREWNAKTEYDALLVFPADDVHDSDYQCIAIVGLIYSQDENQRKIHGEICTTGSDDLEIIPHQGAEVFGGSYRLGVYRIDCLPTSGALQFHSPYQRKGKFRVGVALSSIQVEIVPLPATGM